MLLKVCYSLTKNDKTTKHFKIIESNSKNEEWHLSNLEKEYPTYKVVLFYVKKHTRE